MGRPSEQRNFGEVGIVPNDIKAVFDELDIEKTWDYLEKTFRLNKIKWKRLFEEERLLPSNLSKGERFIIFGKRHLEEPICKLLFRDHGKSQTWIGLMPNGGAAVTNADAKAHDSMKRSETFRQTVGATCAVGCVMAAAWTVSAGVTFCGKA